MILGISQLAFDKFEDLESSLETLIDNDIQNIEVVYPKMESNPLGYTSFFIQQNIQTKSTQSILFGSDVKDFLDESFIKHIEKIIKTNTSFGVEVSVLGSPKQRLEFREHELISQFKAVDLILESTNQILCIEPNCKNYGGSYFFTVTEIADFIRKGEFKNIKTMLDTHNIINEGQSPTEIYNQFRDLILHVHVSENNLSDFIESNEHKKLSNALKSNNYKGIITYEVLPSKNLKFSLEKFKNIYK
jgi:sugar phosphate isomerase/epimerase